MGQIPPRREDTHEIHIVATNTTSSWHTASEPTAPGVPSSGSQFFPDRPTITNLPALGQCSRCENKAFVQDFPGQPLLCNVHGGVSTEGYGPRVAPFTQEEIESHGRTNELIDQLHQQIRETGGSTEELLPHPAESRDVERHLRPVLPAIGTPETQGIQDFRTLQNSTALAPEEFERQKTQHGYKPTYNGSKMDWDSRYATGA